MAFKYGAYLIIDKEDREYIIKEIETSPKLGNRFYEIYELVKPKTLKPDFSQHFFIHRSSNGGYCACREAVYEAIYPKYTSAFEIMPLVSFVESKISKERCLDYYVIKRLDENDLGIRKVFGKDMEELDDRELIELALILQNPYWYKKKKENFNQNLDREIDLIERKLKYKTK